MQDTSFDLFAPNVTDGYKVGHRPLYPEGTNFAYSNGTFRSDKLFIGSKSASVFWDHKVLLVGIQAAIREVNGLWARSFFNKPKDVVCRRYARRMDAYLGKGAVDVKCFERLHDLGYLPVSILALKEGSRVNMNVPVYTVYNTVGEFFWIVNYLETLLSSILWKIATNATIAYEYRRTFEHWAAITGVDSSFVDVQGHDFSFRGMSGPEDAARCGLGHLVVFKGTDTIPAIDYAEDMYFADVDQEFIATSVVATEHAVATSNILFNVSKLLKATTTNSLQKIAGDQWALDQLKAKGELEFIREAITVKHPSGIISLVSDSFDFWKVVTETLSELKDDVLNRTPDANGFAKVVVRPDSGDPVEVICGMEYFTSEELEAEHYINVNYGIPKKWIEKDTVDRIKKLDKTLCTHSGATYKAYRMDKYPAPEGFTVSIDSWWLVPLSVEPLTPEEKGAVQCLWEIFNGTVTPKGFRQLHERIGLIYGDSITVERAHEILRRLAKKGFASSNVVFGIGSYTYQHNTRDTFGFAVKSTAIRVDDEVIELFKAPKTEKDTLKKSAKGFLKVNKTAEGDFVLDQEQSVANLDDLIYAGGELQQVYQDGLFAKPVTLSDITKELMAA